MTGPVLVDSNLLLLLVVGSTDPSYVAMHKNLSDYDESDLATLFEAVSMFSEIILVPHIAAEVSSLARQIRNPARARIQAKLAAFIEEVVEVPVPSREGVRRAEFDAFGLTDAVLLALCELGLNDLDVSLLTADQPLALRAEAMGLSVLNFRDLQ